MNNYRELTGDLIELAKDGEFDVIAHGCNCFCVMGSGIAPNMNIAFGCADPEKYPLESSEYKGDMDKLGRIQFSWWKPKGVVVINAYTQFHYWNKSPYGIQLDYDALSMCMRKINYYFSGEKIGLPKIGCGLAGGDWERVKGIIQKELKDCDVTIVNYKK